MTSTAGPLVLKPFKSSTRALGACALQSRSCQQIIAGEVFVEARLPGTSRNTHVPTGPVIRLR
jgi:hypothetical protein